MAVDQKETFPWIKDVIQSFATSFIADYTSDALSALHGNIDKEIKWIYSSNDHTVERSEALYRVITYLYEHMRLKIAQHSEFKNATLSCVKLMSQIIKVGLILTQGLIDSEWIERILTAIRLFPGEKVLVYDALLLVNGLKKIHHKPYSAILRNIMTEDHHEFIIDPLVYMKIILLFRRLKALVLNRYKEKYTILTTKIKPPTNLISWLASLDVNGYSVYLKNFKYKRIALQLMKSSLPESFLRKIRFIALNQYNFEVGSSEFKITEITEQPSDICIIDNTSNTEFAQNNLDMLVNSKKSLTKKKVNSTQKQRKLKLNENNKNLLLNNKPAESSSDIITHKYAEKSSKCVIVSKKKQKSNLLNYNKYINVSKKKKKSKCNLVKNAKVTIFDQDISDSDLLFHGIEDSNTPEHTLNEANPELHSENKISNVHVNEFRGTIVSHKYTSNEHITASKKKKKSKHNLVKNIKSKPFAILDEDESDIALLFHDVESNSMSQQLQKNMSEKDSKSCSEIKINNQYINESNTDNISHKLFTTSNEHTTLLKKKKKSLSKHNLGKNSESKITTIQNEDVSDSALFFYDVEGSMTSPKKLKTISNVSNSNILQKRNFSEDTDNNTTVKNVLKKKSRKRLKSSKCDETASDKHIFSDDKLDSNLVFESHKQLMFINKNNELENSLKNDDDLFVSEISGKKRKKITSTDDSAISDDKGIYLKKLMLKKVNNEDETSVMIDSSAQNSIHSVVNVEGNFKQLDIKQKNENDTRNFVENTQHKYSLEFIPNQNSHSENVKNENFKEENNISCDARSACDNVICVENIDILPTEIENNMIIQPFENPKVTDNSSTVENTNVINQNKQLSDQNTNKYIATSNTSIGSCESSKNTVNNEDFNNSSKEKNLCSINLGKLAFKTNLDLIDTESSLEDENQKIISTILENVLTHIAQLNSMQLENESALCNRSMKNYAEYSAENSSNIKSEFIRNSIKSTCSNDNVDIEFFQNKNMHKGSTHNDEVSDDSILYSIDQQDKELQNVQNDVNMQSKIKNCFKINVDLTEDLEIEYGEPSKNLSIISSVCDKKENYEMVPKLNNVKNANIKHIEKRSEYDATLATLHPGENSKQVENNFKHSDISLVNQEKQSEKKDLSPLDKINNKNTSLDMLVNETYIHKSYQFTKNSPFLQKSSENSIKECPTKKYSDFDELKDVNSSNSIIINNENTERNTSNENTLTSIKLPCLDSTCNSTDDIEIFTKKEESSLQLLVASQKVNACENSEKININFQNDTIKNSKNNECSNNIRNSVNDIEISVKENPEILHPLLESEKVVNVDENSGESEIANSQDNIIIKKDICELNLSNKNIVSSTEVACSDSISNSVNKAKTSVKEEQGILQILPGSKKVINVCQVSDNVEIANSQDDVIVNNEGSLSNKNIVSTNELTCSDSISNSVNDITVPIKVIESNLSESEKFFDGCKNSNQFNSVNSQGDNIVDDEKDLSNKNALSSNKTVCLDDDNKSINNVTISVKEKDISLELSLESKTAIKEKLLNNENSPSIRTTTEVKDASLHSFKSNFNEFEKIPEKASEDCKKNSSFESQEGFIVLEYFNEFEKTPEKASEDCKKNSSFESQEGFIVLDESNSDIEDFKSSYPEKSVKNGSAVKDLKTSEKYNFFTNKSNKENNIKKDLLLIADDIKCSLENNDSKRKLISDVSAVENDCSSVFGIELPKKLEIKCIKVNKQNMKNNPAEISESMSVSSFCSDKNYESFSDISSKNKDKKLHVESVASVPINNFSSAASTELFSMYRNELMLDEDRTNISLSSRDGILSNCQDNYMKSPNFSSDHSDEDTDSSYSSQKEEEEKNAVNKLTSEDSNTNSIGTSESVASKNSVLSTAKAESDSLDDKHWSEDKNANCTSISDNIDCAHEEVSAASVLPRQSLRLKNKAETKCEINNEENSVSDISKIEEASVKELKLVLTDCKSNFKDINASNDLCNSVANVSSCSLIPDNNELIIHSQTSGIKKNRSTTKSKAKQSSVDCSIPHKRYSLRHCKSSRSTDDSANLGIDLNKLKFDTSNTKCTRSGRESKFVKLLTSDVKLQDNPSNAATIKRETRSSAINTESNIPSYNLRNRKPIIAPPKLKI